jgi:EAL domain-containing protein (putative c-di-GMP-specific phosphodiesterase class I)
MIQNDAPPPPDEGASQSAASASAAGAVSGANAAGAVSGASAAGAVSGANAAPTAATKEAAAAEGSASAKPISYPTLPAMTDAAPKTASGARRRVLVAEDEQALARSLSRLLVGGGYEVVIAQDGTSAAAAVKSQEFDVILSDIQMPGMSGLDLLRIVREHDLDVPVVLMTADPRIETAAQAVELGALQYLVKPVPVETLFKAMERAVKLHLMAKMKRETMRLIGREEPVAGDRAGLIASFERAVETMWIAFQPIVLKDGRTFGYEALLRSNEPSLPHPGAVLSAAERLERLPELGQRIRELAARSFESVSPELLLFVNLHPRDLLDPALVAPDRPLSRIARRVVLEITERAAIDDIKDIRGRIGALRAMGYRIAVDDLGAGYAGLASFALLEPDFVKFDMSLVRDVHTSVIRKKLIGAMTTLCKDMGMRVVAEGIETVEERDTVLDLGCDLFQGYLLARPGAPFPVASWPMRREPPGAASE